MSEDQEILELIKTSNDMVDRVMVLVNQINQRLDCIEEALDGQGTASECRDALNEYDNTTGTDV